MNYGNKVVIILRPEPWGKTEPITVVLRNVHEIHYNYNNSGRIAFESNIHGTGILYDISQVMEFETEEECEKQDEF